MDKAACNRRPSFAVISSTLPHAFMAIEQQRIEQEFDHTPTRRLDLRRHRHAGTEFDGFPTTDGLVSTSAMRAA